MTRKDRTEGIYSRREVLDESERRQYCLIQLKDLLSYAYRYSEDVKKRFDRAQFNVEKFKTLSDIKHIPILKKKELIFLQSMGPRLGGLLTKDIGDLKRIFLSPGPIFDPEDRGEDYWGYTEAFYSVGFRPGDAVQNTFNYQLTPAGLMFEEPLRNLGCAVIPAGPTDASTQLDIMQKLRVSGYVGTPSFLMHLAQKAEEKGLNLRKDLFLEVAFVTGERLSEKMRSQMEKKYDLIMRQGYGTADVGCIGYECFHKTGLHIANRCYVEICHPDTGIPLKDGEVGEIVVTAFNKTYPLIRLAEVHLIYAEATCELNGGTISDEDLNKSINKNRARARVAPLTNALIANVWDAGWFDHATGKTICKKMNMLDEIRRERACELFGEGFRSDDLKRWGIAHINLRGQKLGRHILGTAYETEKANDATYFGEPCYYPEKYPLLYGIYQGSGPNDPDYGRSIATLAGNLLFSQRDYLSPIPLVQIRLNPQLKQNPGW